MKKALWTLGVVLFFCASAFGQVMDMVMVGQAADGKTRQVLDLLNRGYDVNLKWNGRTALVAAAENGHTDTVRALLEKGADANSKDDQSGRTALMYAAARGYTDTVRILLEGGADVNVADKEGKTALAWAEQQNHADIVTLLKNPGPTAQNWQLNEKLIEAAKAGNPQEVRKLLTLGADPNALYPGVRPLQLADSIGNADAVQALLEAGADVDEKDVHGTGSVALLTAAAHGHTDIVRALLDKNAYADSTDDKGRTALMYAAQAGNIPMARLLLEHGAKVNEESEDRRTALMEAVKTNNTDLIGLLRNTRPLQPSLRDGQKLVSVTNIAEAETLLKLGVDPNARDSRGETALVNRCYNLDFVRLLLRYGADVNERERGKLPPLICATWAGKPDVVRLLLENHANVHARFAGKTAFTMAAGGYIGMGAQPEVLRVLLERGVNIEEAVNALDYARSQLDTSYRSQYTQVINLLETAGSTSGFIKKDWEQIEQERKRLLANAIQILGECVAKQTPLERCFEPLSQNLQSIERPIDNRADLKRGCEGGDGIQCLAAGYEAEQRYDKSYVLSPR